MEFWKDKSHNHKNYFDDECLKCRISDELIPLFNHVEKYPKKENFDLVKNFIFENLEPKKE
jgi:hypothetical protein